MTYAEAVAYQKELYAKGQYVVVHQEHDCIGEWYVMPAEKEWTERELSSRESQDG